MDVGNLERSSLVRSDIGIYHGVEREKERLVLIWNCQSTALLDALSTYAIYEAPSSNSAVSTLKLFEHSESLPPKSWTTFERRNFASRIRRTKKVSSILGHTLPLGSMVKLQPRV